MAKVKLLSDEWFAMVEKANTTVGDLPLSPAMQKICFNILILKDESDIKATPEEVKDTNNPRVNEDIHDISQPKHSMQFAQGKLHLGSAETAETTMSISDKTLECLLSTMKSSDAMQAFINGDIQISGDISQMMAWQTAKMSDEQNALYAMIIEHTEL